MPQNSKKRKKSDVVFLDKFRELRRASFKRRMASTTTWRPERPRINDPLVSAVLLFRTKLEGDVADVNDAGDTPPSSPIAKD